MTDRRLHGTQEELLYLETLLKAIEPMTEDENPESSDTDLVPRTRKLSPGNGFRFQSLLTISTFYLDLHYRSFKVIAAK